jgi:hypothetical protein
VSEIQPQFDQFVKRVSLRDKQEERIGSAFRTLQEYLCESYGIEAGDVLVQGSVANGTAVRPLEGGEYDLDIVVVVPDANGLDANQALMDLEAILERQGRYSGKLKAKKPCIRIQYADDEIGGFHIDVVPARLHPNGSAPIQVPRRDEGWHDSAPREFTSWCHAQGDGFRRSIKALKRWRDDQQDVRQAIKSIVLQVLVARATSPSGSDAQRLATVFSETQTFLAQQPGVPEVPNPVLPSENLTENWTLTSFNDFRKEVAAAQAKAQEALNATDDADASALWAEILGEDFPVSSPSAAGLVLGDVSHARSLSDEGWYQQIDPGSSISIQATVFSKARRRKVIKNYEGKQLLLAGWEIKFFADVAAPAGGTIWWQVVNTGDHARSRNGLRGEFFKGRDLNNNPTSDQRLNWESTAYTGVHLIEAFLVRGSTVAARSGQLRVHIKNRRR